MKDKIKILRCYNLLNENGRKLRLYLGRYENYVEAMVDYGPDKGYRWMFEGGQIPMPVRSDTWFNGFPEAVMLDWLKGNGWALHTAVDMYSGNATVYELPFHDEPSKGNENPINMSDECNRKAFEDAINRYMHDHNTLMAVRLYRYAHGGSLVDARKKVMEITGC